MIVVSWVGFSRVHGEGPVWSGLTRTSQDTAQDHRQAHLSEVVAYPWMFVKFPHQTMKDYFHSLKYRKYLCNAARTLVACYPKKEDLKTED